MGKFIEKKENYNNAVERLQEICDKYDYEDDILRDSLIKRFEFSYETCWKVLKEYLAEEGIVPESYSPRAVFKSSYQIGIINDEQLWLNMIKDRNISTHEYNQDKITELAEKIVKDYLKLFIELDKKLN